MGFVVHLNHSQCTQVAIDAAVADLADDWLSTAHIGVTASTGELSDNHDVIRIETFRCVTDFCNKLV
jgi:Legume-like lectin family